MGVVEERRWIGSSRTCCSARASGWRPGRVTHQCQSGPKRSPSRPRPHGLRRVHSRSRPRIGRDRPRRCLVNPFVTAQVRAGCHQSDRPLLRGPAHLLRGDTGVSFLDRVWGDNCGLLSRGLGLTLFLTIHAGNQGQGTRCSLVCRAAARTITTLRTHACSSSTAARRTRTRTGLTRTSNHGTLQTRSPTKRHSRWR